LVKTVQIIKKYATKQNNSKKNSFIHVNQYKVKINKFLKNNIFNKIISNKF